MDPRIHAALDGDLAPEALSPAERAELARARAALAALAAPLREAAVPDLTARVMAALPPRRSPVAAALAWLWRPRPVRLVLRPAYALAGAMAASGLFLLPSDRPGLPEPAPVAAVAEAAPVLVQFRLSAPGAQRVALAGTFTAWRPAVELRETAPGEWSALVPLAPGVHDYAFVVDDERWVVDPHAPEVDDSFGGTNSRLSLPPVALQS